LSAGANVSASGTNQRHQVSPPMRCYS
jgi:hypothetical protein